MEKLGAASGMMKEANYVVVKGITTGEEDFAYQVNRRGFLVEHYASPVQPATTANAMLSLSAKLTVKLAVTTETNLGSNSDRALAGAVDILLRTKGIQFEEAWLTHNAGKLEKVMAGDAAAGLVLVNDYYGSEIAFYMEWLKFYTGYLTIPAMTGLSLFALQYYRGELDSKWNPLFNILMCVWGSLFIESWKRRSSELSNVWDVEDAETLMDATDIAKRKSEKKMPVDRKLRFAVTVPAMLSMMAAVVRVMIFFLDEIGQADIKYGTQSYMKYYPTAAYSVVPIVTAVVYEKVAVFMNDFEAYPTRTEAESNLVIKRFLFQFVNRYCALFYTAFYLQDIEKLRSLLLSMLVMNALINNVTELVVPFVPVLIAKARKKMAKTVETKKSNAIKRPPPVNVAGSKGILKNGNDLKSKTPSLSKAGSVNFGGTVTVPDPVFSPSAAMQAPIHPAPVPGDGWNTFLDDERPVHDKGVEETSDLTPRVDFETLLKRELRLAPYSLGDDYMEMLVQYGYVTMFVVVFPLGPLLALLNNVVEQKVDMFKLSVSRRPQYSDRSGIGAWLGCLEFINVVSVITNCFYLCMVSDHLGMIIPSAYQEQLTGSTGGRFIAMVLLEHVMLAMKFLLAYLIPDVPMWVLERQAELKMAEMDQRKQMNLRDLMDMDIYDRNPNMTPDYFENSRPMSGLTADSHSRQYVINKLTSGKGAGYFYNPQNLAWLFCVPALLTQLEVNPMYYIPVAGALFSYLQNEKNKNNIHQALGIVTDAKVLEHIRGELPAWITDSDCERAEWLNSILQKLWPFISSGVEKMVKEKVQPILDKNATRVVPSLRFTTINLGSVAPRIISVKTYPSNDVACVRMDMELKWSSDMEVVLQVGKTPPLDVELGDTQFSAIVRIELKPLINKLPGFGAINLTCMKAPHVDFSVKVGAVDVLNVGPSEMSIGTYVRNLIRNIVCNMMLYPKSICIPLMEDKAMVDELQTPVAPKGLLHLNIISAKRLKAADFLTSDPYVEIRYMTEVLRTETKSKTLNPVWDASFDLMIFDKKAQQIELVVYDEDVVSDEFLGRVILHLDTLIPNKPSDILELDLMEVETGCLQLTALYTPLGVDVPTDTVEEAADILFNMSQDSLRTDILVEDVKPVDSPLQGANLSQFTTGMTSIVAAKRVASSMKSRLSSPSTPTRASNGVLTISRISCQKLRNNNTSFGGSIRPYCVFSAGGSSKQTRIQHLADVKFDENFHFMVKDGNNATMSIKVMDQYKFVKDQCIGELSLRVSSFISSPHGVYKEYPLESRHGECSITFKVMWMASTA